MRSLALSAPVVLLAACSLVAGLGPQPGPLPPSPDGSVAVDAPADVADGADAAEAEPSAPVPMLGPCTVFPADNPWNEDISAAPLDTVSMTNILPNMSPDTPLHPDWGDTTNGYGIPYVISQVAPVPIDFTGDLGESDQAPCAGGGSLFCYPIPATAPVEAGGGYHVLVVDTTGAPSDCTLYEIIGASKDDADVGWTADHGAIFHLGSDVLRPDGMISTDQAGLPVLPGLVRYDEVAAGHIDHALRFTMKSAYLGYIHPATYSEGTSTSGLPPMGMRLRLRASYDLSNVTGASLVILTALEKYGIILADRGSNWYITGDENDGWTSILGDIVAAFDAVHGSDFEIVQSGPVLTSGL